jgi:predicted negative regulator of RcsB-dependent stress response
MSKRQTSSRRTSEPDDLFIARVLNLGKWAEANQQVITVAAVVLAIGVFGLISYGNSRRSMNTAAAQQLEIVHQGIGIADLEGAKADLVRFLDQFGGSVYEGEARLLLGELYLETDDPQQALAVLAPLGSRPNDPIEFQGAALLGAAYEQERRWSDAVEIYLTIADRADLDFQVRDALAAAARIRATQGDTEGAIALYQRVLAEFDENSPQRGVYEMRIEELRTAANT